MSERLMVIGGTAAGLSAASKAKREGDFDVTVIERTGYTSYGSCGLPYYVGGLIREADELVTLTPGDITGKRGMRLHLRCEARSIDRIKKLVQVLDLSSQTSFSVPYDKLVIATGASPIRPGVPGAELAGVLALRTVEDGVALRKNLNQGGVCIVGGGFIGLELAAELIASGQPVTVVERLPRILPTIIPEFAEMVEDSLKESGATLLTGTELTGILGENGRVCRAVTSKGAFPCSTVVMCVGVRPNSALAKEAGIALGRSGGLLVNTGMQTSDPNIWACGDCVETYSVVTGEPIYMPLGTHANKQGKVAGSVIAGGSAKNPGVLGSQITKILHLYVGGTGLTGEQAARSGFDPVSVTIEKNDRASYYPGGQKCRVHLVADRTTGRLLGGQIIGGESAAGRVNVLAAALSAGMSARELAGLDLVYAPPVAPVYDPITVAAEQLTKQMERQG